MDCRREFIRNIGCWGVGLSLFSWVRQDVNACTSGQEFYLATKKDAAGNYEFAFFDQNLEMLHTYPLKGRAHQVLGLSSNTVAVFSRRPGSWIRVIDLETPAQCYDIEAPGNVFFTGHGDLSSDGQTLYVSEHDFEARVGQISVYNYKTKTGRFVRSHAMSAGGIGPHEIRVVKHLGRETLVVAVGGLHTHPDFPRQKLNIDSMSSNISLIDLKSESVLETYKLSSLHQKLSIRHIDVNHADGELEVIAACQYQGYGVKNFYDTVAVLKQKKFSLIQEGESVKAKMKNYAGSICFDTSREFFAVSCPKGHTAFVYGYDQNRNAYLHQQISMTDVCGLTAGRAAGEFILSSGYGQIKKIDVLSSGIKRQVHHNERSYPEAFDNHMAKLPSQAKNSSC